MSVVETNSQVAGQPASVEQTRSKALQVLAAIAFFGTVGVATVGWTGFLIWIGLALSGF